MSEGQSIEDLFAQDPTVVLNGVPPDEANGSIPEPFERYGQPLPPEWIPLYKKPMRTATRKLRVCVIGGSISALNLAHKVYHEYKLDQAGLVELCFYEANEQLGGTWLVNTYPGVACDVPAHIYTFRESMCSRSLVSSIYETDSCPSFLYMLIAESGNRWRHTR